MMGQYSFSAFTGPILATALLCFTYDAPAQEGEVLTPLSRLNNVSNTTGTRATNSRAIKAYPVRLARLAENSGRGGGPPANDECAEAQEVIVHSETDCPANSITGDNSDSVVTTDAPACDESDAGYQDVWYSFNSGDNTMLTITTEIGTIADIGVELMDVCGGISLFCNFGTLIHEVEVIMNTDYLLRVYSNNDLGAGGTFTLCVSGSTGTSAPANDECANAQPLLVNADGDCPLNAVDGDNGSSLVTADAPACDESANGFQDVWYSFNSGTDTAVVITIEPGTITDLGVELLSACGGTSIMCDFTETTYTFEVLENTDYIIRIYSNLEFGDGGTFTVCLAGSAGGGETPNDDCETAQPLTVNAAGDCPANAVNGDSSGATVGMAAPECDDSVDGFQDVWYSFNSGTNAMIDVFLTLGTIGDIGVEILTFCGGASVFCDFNSLEYEVPVTPATDYVLRVFSNNDFGMGGTFTICLSGTSSGGPANDDCATAQPIAVNNPLDCPANTVSGDNGDAAITTDAPFCGESVEGYQDVWYFLNSGISSLIDVTVTLGTAQDIGIELLDACSGNSLFCDFSELEYAVDVFPGTDYYLRVFTNLDLGSGGTFDLCVTGDQFTGVDDASASNSWSVYPNPSSGGFNILAGDIEGNYIMRLVDITGRIIHSTNAVLSAGEPTWMRLSSDIAAGTYILRASSEGVSHETRVIVE